MEEARCTSTGSSDEITLIGVRH